MALAGVSGTPSFPAGFGRAPDAPTRLAQSRTLFANPCRRESRCAVHAARAGRARTKPTLQMRDSDFWLLTPNGRTLRVTWAVDGSRSADR
jgi:hypothetical protein